MYSMYGICEHVETVAIISIEPAGERVQIRPQTGDGQLARLDLVELHSVPVFWIRIHMIRIRIRIQIQHFWLNTDPEPGF